MEIVKGKEYEVVKATYGFEVGDKVTPSTGKDNPDLIRGSRTPEMVMFSALKNNTMGLFINPSCLKEAA